jgi:hypothetical protein
MDDDVTLHRIRERLHRINFATPHGLIEISWESRDWLIDLLRAKGWSEEVEAIEAVGVSAPVELAEPIGRYSVAAVIMGGHRTRALPADLLALREALRD